MTDVPPPEAEIFDRDEGQFAPQATSVLFREPSTLFHLAIGVSVTGAIGLLAWLGTATTTVSMSMPGEVVSLDPDRVAALNEEFEIVELKRRPGEKLAAHDVLLTYRDHTGQVHPLENTDPAILVQYEPLQSGTRYPAGTRVATLRGADPRLGLRLFVNPESIGAVREGAAVALYVRQEPLEAEPLPGTILTAPSQEAGANGRYFVQAAFSTGAETTLKAAGVRLLPGLAVSGELPIRKQSLLTRLVH